MQDAWCLLQQANIVVDSKQAGAAPGELMTAEGLWSRYATRLTSIVVRHLRADYWHMPPVSIRPQKLLLLNKLDI